MFLFDKLAGNGLYSRRKRHLKHLQASGWQLTYYNEFGAVVALNVEAHEQKVWYTFKLFVAGECTPRFSDRCTSPNRRNSAIDRLLWASDAEPVKPGQAK